MPNRDSKSLHDLDATAADETGADYYITAVRDDNGVLSDAGINVKTQLPKILGLSSLALDSGTWSASIPADDSLVVQISTGAVLSGYTRHSIAIDDDTAPTLSTDGVTGAIPGTYTLPDYLSHTLYLWIYDGADWSFVTPIPSQSDGGTVEGIVVIARDTKGPVGGTVTVDQASVSDPNTQVKLTFPTPSDAGTGYSHTNVYNGSSDSHGQADQLLYEIISSGDVFSGLIPGDLYGWTVIHFDVAGNGSAPQQIGFTTESTLNAGTANLTASVITALESDYKATATFSRSGRQGTVALTVDVSTRDRITRDGYEFLGGEVSEFNTATDVDATADKITFSVDPAWPDCQEVTYGTDGKTAAIGLTHGETYFAHSLGAGAYTFYLDFATCAAVGTPIALTATGAVTQLFFKGAGIAYEKITGTTISWGTTDDANKTQDIRLVNRAGRYDGAFQIEIDSGSESTGGAVGSTPSALVNVTSSATGVSGYAQSTDAAKIAVVDLSDAGVTRNPGTDPTQTWNVVPDGRAASGNTLQPSSACWPGLGSATTRDAAAPDADIPINFAITGDHDVWLRMWRQGTFHDTVHGDFNDGGVSTLLGFHSNRYDTANAPTDALDTTAQGSHYEWTRWKQDGTARTLTVLSAGLNNFQLIVQDYQSKVDRIVIAPTAGNANGPGTTYDPNDATTGRGNSTDDYYGVTQSALNTGAGSEANPYAPSGAIPPKPPQTIAATTLSPDNGSTTGATGQNVQISAVFNGVVTLIEEFYITVSANVVATGNPTIAGSQVSITVTDTLSNNVTVVPVLKCYVRDNADGVVKYYDSTGGWTYQTQPAAASGDTLFQLDNFNHRSVGAYTVAQAMSDFPVNKLGYENHTPNVSGTTIVLDPAGGTEKVMQCRHEIGNGGGSFNCIFDLGTGAAYDSNGPETIYRRWSFYLHPNNDDIKSLKLASIGDGTQLEMSHGASGPPVPGVSGGFAGVVSMSVYFTIDSADAWPARGNRSSSGYYYDYNAVQRNDFHSTAGDGLESVALQVHIPGGEWIIVDEKIKAGTAGNVDGEYKCWLTIQSLGWTRKQVASFLHEFRGPSGGNISPRRWWEQKYLGGSQSDPLNKARTAPHIVYRKGWIARTTPFWTGQG